MEQPLIIEVRDLLGQLLERKLVRGGTVRIGRAFDGDIILDDPYVCPIHCRLELRPETGWVTIDNASVNGVRRMPGAEQISELPITHDLRIHIGRTEIRFLDPNTPLAPTLPLRHAPYLTLITHRKDVARATLAMLATLGTCAISGLLSYSDEDYGLSEHALFTFLASLLLLLPWASLWSLLSRVTHHRSFFFRHLAIGAWGFTALSLTLLFVDILAFGFTTPALATIGIYGSYGIILSVMLVYHLRLATQLSDRGRIGTGLGVSATLIACALLVHWRLHQSYTANVPLDGELLPPSLLFTPDEPTEHAASAVERILEKLEQEESAATS